jgi:hypothetical protein
MLQNKIIGKLISVINFLWVFWLGYCLGWLCFGNPNPWTYILIFAGGYILMGIITLIIIYLVSITQK